MAPPHPVIKHDETGVGAQLQAGAHKEPLAGIVVSVILTLASLTILSIFLTQRCGAVKVWRKLPYVAWVVLAIYLDSYLFVFSTAILQYGFGVDTALSICDAAILLCLVCYVSTKVLIYLFLVEKVYIIRGSMKKRMQSKLYWFNSLGMIGLYAVVAILNFVFRFTRMENGQCIIGMQRVSMIPLITFDALVNVYLTVLFIVPLISLYSFKHVQRTPANLRLRSVATRTLIGALCTLASSIVNLSVLMGLDGEPGWVCLMCCNSDILFSAIVIQWITSKDNKATEGKHDHSHHEAENNVRICGRALSSPPHQRPSSLSSLTSPSTKPVLEDVADMGLDRVRRLSLNKVGSAVSSRRNDDNSDEIHEAPRPVHQHPGLEVQRGSRYSLSGFQDIDTTNHFTSRVK